MLSLLKKKIRKKRIYEATNSIEPHFLTTPNYYTTDCDVVKHGKVLAPDLRAINFHIVEVASCLTYRRGQHIIVYENVGDK